MKGGQHCAARHAPMADMFKANSIHRKLIPLSLRDVADFRDQYYKPPMISLREEVIPTPSAVGIRDQKSSSACVGFALAAVIDRLRGVQLMQEAASATMLYGMARLHDDIPDNDHPGSTLRAALKGFFHNGVCTQHDACDEKIHLLQPDGWELDMNTAKAARDISLGAYFRLNHILNDYHVAINETNAILVSARIHDGWTEPNADGQISHSTKHRGLHAFAIVGYTSDGFLVQNSWGADWGGSGGLPPGIALWTYPDWFENVRDAWVLRLGVSSPQAFNFKVAQAFSTPSDPDAAKQITAPRRQDIFGHYLNLDDGQFVENGRFGQRLKGISTLKSMITDAASGNNTAHPCRHLLVFGHGALTTRVQSARRIRAWKETFLSNGIYPLHVMWQTGFNSNVADVLADLLLKTENRMGTSGDWLDQRLEELARPLGRKLWRDLKVSAALTFGHNQDGGRALHEVLVQSHTHSQMKIHFAGVSAGSYLLAGMLNTMRTLKQELSTATLLAPACSLNHYSKNIAPRIDDAIRSIWQFNLSPHREDNDHVEIYNKSLLHLVANALASPGTQKLLGLQDHCENHIKKKGPTHDRHRIFVAGDSSPRRTNAKSHQGFEKDPATMNALLEHILGEKPARDKRFSSIDLDLI